MRRLRRANKTPEIAAEVLGLVLLIAWLSPQGRQHLADLTSVVVLILILSTLAVVGRGQGQVSDTRPAPLER